MTETDAPIPDPSTFDLVTAQELEDWAAHFASRATNHYPEAVFPHPVAGVTSTPDCYSAAGYRNAYRSVARDLRERAEELRQGENSGVPDLTAHLEAS